VGDLLSIPGYHSCLIDKRDVGQLQSLLEACADYCILIDGHPPSSTSAINLLTDRPEGKSLDDIVLVGIYTQENEMVSLLDALRDYPGEGDMWIGLLLVHPGHRDKGLGTMIVRAFEDWALAQGVEQIFLGVVEANDKALKFWQSVGFQVTGRQPPRKFDNLTHVVITMVYELTQVHSD
jgi:GNAT superfamily N-acetyltransferase